MESNDGNRILLARCVVCRGNIFRNEPHEIWEGGYYCKIHSLTYLRERAREYAALIAESRTVSTD